MHCDIPGTVTSLDRKQEIRNVQEMEKDESLDVCRQFFRSKQPSTQQQTKIVDIMKPVLISMVLSGLLDPTIVWKYKNVSSTTISKYFKCYRVFVILLSLLNFFRYFSTYAFETNRNEKLIASTMIQVWFLLCITHFYVCYKTCKTGNLQSFFCQWEYQNEEDKHACAKRIRKFVILSVIFSWSIVIGNMSFTAYCIYFTSEFDTFISPIKGDNKFFPIAGGVYLVVHFYLSCAWIFPCSLCGALVYSLYLRFKNLSNEIELQARKRKKKASQIDIEMYRKDQDALCCMLETADDTFNICIGACLLLSLVLILMLVYNMCWHDSVRLSANLLIGHIFWLFGVLSIVGFVCVLCCLVSHWAHYPVSALHSISLQDSSPVFFNQISLLISRLNGHPIGFTACNMLVIDKSVVLSIAGALTTYIVVLIQFQQ